MDDDLALFDADEMFAFGDIDAWLDALVDEAVDAFGAPPGDCDWIRHSALQSRVHPVCDRPSACDPSMHCSRLSQLGRLNVACASARAAINQECYRGGNAGHRQAHREAGFAANSCRQLYRAKNCAQGGPRGGRSTRRMRDFFAFTS